MGNRMREGLPVFPKEREKMMRAEIDAKGLRNR